ncbi:MAG TPA: cytochrome c [Thermoanaerobaculia bacterium]|nr:cytochrome c [Thermoanaerobaculia bacterium]
MKRAAMVALLLLVAACRRDMVDRPEKRPLGSSAFFDDRTASRPLVADVVARPAEAGPHTIARGREQYAIYCQPCHGARGDGNGVIVQHGFPRPPDIRGRNQTDTIRAVTSGEGVMYSLPQADAQSIALYVQSLR